MNKKKYLAVLICLAMQRTAESRIALQAAQSNTSQILSQNVSIENTLRPQESHSFRVRLNAGDYVETELVERGINVILDFYDPAGKRLVEEETRTGNFDTSSFEAIAPAAGEFRLEIKGASKDPGRYRLTVINLRAATERDRQNVEAHQKELEAIKLSEQATPQTLRSAIEKEEEVLAYRIANSDRQGEARARAGLSGIYFYVNDRQRSLQYLERALELYRSLNDAPNAASVLNNLGAVHQEMGEPEKALDYFMQSLPGLRALGDKYREAVAVHNLGWCYQTLGDFKNASEFYREALPLWRLGGNASGEAQTVNNLGLTYYHLGDLPRSLEYFQRALELRRTFKDARGEAQTLGNLARVSIELRDTQKANDFFRQSLTVAQKAEDKSNQASALLGLATLSPAMTPVDQALEYANEALRLSNSIQDARGNAEALFTLGRTYALRGDNDLATEKYRQALDLQTTSGDRRAAAHTMMLLADVVRQKDLAEAQSLMEKSLDLIESLRGQVADPDLRTSFLATMQDYYDAYIDLLMRRHDREPAGGYAELALHASERARARGLLDALAENPSQIRQGIQPELLQRERKLRAALNVKDQQLRQLSSARRDTEATAAKRELDQILDELSQLQGEIRSRSPRYANLIQPQPATTKELQAQLDSDSLLLEYWLGRERSFVWAVTADSISSYTLPPAQAIQESALQFFNAVTQRTPDLDRIAASLSETLLGPVSDRLNKKELVVVSHGALQYLPFAALPLPGASKGAATTLVNQHEIVSLPSASVLAALRSETAKRRDPQKLIAILADPVFSREDPRFSSAVRGRATTRSATPEAIAANGDLTRATEDIGMNELRRLRFSRIEADAIASLVPNNSRLEAVDFQANRETALSSELGQYRILHFATHGLLNSVHPELSGLVFSTVDPQGKPRDGMLRLHEIFNLSLNADLIVLSACQTALGKDIKGEGLIGLTRGFMYAGTPRVVASLWNVEDRATAELMKRFYEGMLKRQLKPAAALREAQLALQRDKRWSAPYYWAGFSLQGEWR